MNLILFATALSGNARNGWYNSHSYEVLNVVPYYTSPAKGTPYSWRHCYYYIAYTTPPGGTTYENTSNDIRVLVNRVIYAYYRGYIYISGIKLFTYNNITSYINLPARCHTRLCPEI